MNEEEKEQLKVILNRIRELSCEIHRIECQLDFFMKDEQEC